MTDPGAHPAKKPLSPRSVDLSHDENGSVADEADERLPVAVQLLHGFNIIFSLSHDRLKLFMQCARAEVDAASAAAGETPTLAELTALAAQFAPEELLHNDTIRASYERMKKGEESAPRRIAKGYPPVHGQDGKLVLLVKPFTEKPQAEEHLGRRFIRRFDNIEPGTVVARLYPPTIGSPGIDALGKPLPAVPGAHCKVEVDSTLQFQPGADEHSFGSFLSTVYGYLEVRDALLRVVETWEIRGDVDVTSGDIDFIGSVVVEGTIQKDAGVSARGSIEIKGDIEGGWAASKTGDLIVHGSVFGDTSARRVSDKVSLGMMERMRRSSRPAQQLTAAGTVKVKALEGASVEAGQAIEILREARNSTLHTQSALVMPQGRLTGGECSVVDGVWADIIGTPGESRTIIHISSASEALLRYREIEEQLAAHKRAEELLRLSLGPFAEEDAVPALPGPQLEKILGLKEKLNRVHASAVILAEEHKTLRENTTSFAPVEIRYNTVLHVGTEITAESERFSVQDSLHGPGIVSYSRDEHRFSVRADQSGGNPSKQSNKR